MRSLGFALSACAIIGCGRIPIGDWDVPNHTGGALQGTSGAGTSSSGAGGSEPTGRVGRATSSGSSGASANTSGAAGQLDDGAALGGSVADAGGRPGDTSEPDAGAIGPQASTAGARGVGFAGSSAVPATSDGGQDTSQGGDTAGGGVASDGGSGGAGTAGGFEDSGGSDAGGNTTGGSTIGGSSTGGGTTGGSDTGGSNTAGSDSGGGDSGGSDSGGTDAGGAPPIPPPVAAWEPCSEDSPITVVATNAEQGCWVGCTNGDVFYGGCDGESWVRTDEPDESATSVPLPDLPVSTIVPLHNDSLRAYVSFVGVLSVHKIWETQTQGQTWLEHSDSTVVDVWSLSYNPLATDRLYAYVVPPDGNNPYIDASTDGGSSYSKMNFGDSLLQLPSGQMDLISTIATYDYSPDHFVVGTINGHLYLTSNGTTECTWGRIGDTVTEMPIRTVTKIAVRPRESSYELWATFAGPLEHGIWVSTGSALDWNNAHAPGLPDGAGSSVVDGWYGVSFNPVFPDTLYLFGTEGAYRTDDHGATWTRTWPRQ